MDTSQVFAIWHLVEVFIVNVFVVRQFGEMVAERVPQVSAGEELSQLRGQMVTDAELREWQLGLHSV